LRRLDGVRPQPVEVDALDDGTLGIDRPQLADAELGRLLDQEIDARPLDRREGEPEIALARLRPALLGERYRAPALADAVDAPEPFAVAAVEQRHRVAGRQPQHRLDVVRLRWIEPDRHSAGEIGRAMKTGAGRCHRWAWPRRLRRGKMRRVRA